MRTNHIFHHIAGFWLIVLILSASCHGRVRIEDYRPLVRPYPTVADSWYNIGIAYTICERDSLAVDAFSRAVRLNPRDADSWFNLGAIYALSEQPEPAAKAFSEALSLPPVHTKHFTRGLAFFSLGRYSEAIPEFRQSIAEHEPHPVSSYIKLGVSCYALGRYPEGIEAFTIGAQTNPKAAVFYNAWFSIGLGYQTLGRNKEAAEAYRQSLRSRPDYAQTYYNLGIVYTLAGDAAGAKEQFEALQRLNTEAAEKLDGFICSGGKQEKQSQRTKEPKSQR